MFTDKFLNQSLVGAPPTVSTHRSSGGGSNPRRNPSRTLCRERLQATGPALFVVKTPSYGDAMTDVSLVGLRNEPCWLKALSNDQPNHGTSHCMPALFSLGSRRSCILLYFDTASCVLMFGSTTSFYLTSLFYNTQKCLRSVFTLSAYAHDRPDRDEPQPRTTPRLAIPAKRHQASNDQRGPEGEPLPAEAATSQPARQPSSQAASQASQPANHAAKQQDRQLSSQASRRLASQPSRAARQPESLRGRRQRR